MVILVQWFGQCNDDTPPYYLTWEAGNGGCSKQMPFPRDLSSGSMLNLGGYLFSLSWTLLGKVQITVIRE